MEDDSASQLSGFVASTAYSSFEPITIRLTKDPELNFTSEDVSWLISIMELGVFFASLISGNLVNRFGRKYVIISIGPICILSWISVIMSKTMLSLIIVRILHGLAAGVAFTIPPIYTAEVADPNWRGRLSGTFQMFWNLGTLYSFSFGPHLSYDAFAYVCLPVPIIFTAIWMFIPESPYHLLIVEREDEARKVLQYFRDGNIEEELIDMKNRVREEMSVKGSWQKLFTDKVERKAFIIVFTVCITKFLGGMTVIVNYALDTFSRTESFLPAEEMSILVAVLLSLIAIIAAFMSDWVGRRPLIIVSYFGCFISHFLSGGYYLIHEKTTIDASNYTWALYVGMSAYCFFSDIGLGPLLPTLQAEMFSASTRGTAAGIIEGMASILCFMVLKFYIPVNEKFGVYANFWFYSFASLIGGIVMSIFLYETAGKTIGRMEDKLNKKKQGSLE